MIKMNPDAPFSAKLVHFSVVNRFRGVADTATDLIVQTGVGGGGCGGEHPLEIGSSYLVYATYSKDHPASAFLEGLAPEVAVSAAIKQLGLLRDSGRSDDLFGNIGIVSEGNNSWPAVFRLKPLAGVKVTAIGTTGDRFSAITDDQGAYAFPHLPSDRYRVLENVPPGFINYEKEPQIQLDQSMKNGGGCRLDSFLIPK